MKTKIPYDVQRKILLELLEVSKLSRASLAKNIGVHPNTFPRLLEYKSLLKAKHLISIVQLYNSMGSAVPDYLRPYLPADAMTEAKLKDQCSKIQALMQIGCTIQETAAALGLNITYLQMQLKTIKPMQDAADMGSALLKVSLRRALFDLAIGDKNPIVCMFLAKQYLGMADRVNVTSDGTPLQMNEEEAARIVEQMIPQYKSMRNILSVSTTTVRLDSGNGNGASAGLPVIDQPISEDRLLEQPSVGNLDGGQ